MSSYLLYDLNLALRAFTAASELQFNISDPNGKIVQNVNFSPISQNNNLILKLNPTHQHVSKSMINFKNRSSYYDVTQIDTIVLTSKNTIFQLKLVCKIWCCHWICWIETSPKMVSNLDSKSLLFLHAKWGKVLTINFIDYLEKYDFLQTTSNIGKLYTIGKHFSLWVWIQHRYLKIRLYLAQINWKNLSFLCENECRRSRHFRQEWRVPFWWRGRDERVGTLNQQRGWSETVKQCWEAAAWPLSLHA